MKIGWIGIGRMGRHLAGHLLEGGHELTVRDLRQDAASDLLERGAQWASSPAEAARRKDVVFTSLLMPEDVREVVLGQDGVINEIEPGSVLVDTSTNSLDVVLEIGDAMSAKGVYFIDSPVSGGARGAETRDLCVMASGDRDAYDRIKPVLDLLGDRVMYCGPVGHGTICKLCHQLFGAGMSQIAQEVLSVGVKAGVDIMTLAEAMSKSAAGRRPPFAGWRKGPARGGFDDTGPYAVSLRLLNKDISLACELGRKFTVPMDLCNIVAQRFREGLNRGWGDMESRGLIRLQEERAGVRLTSSTECPESEVR